jgi:hypothetical protein
MTYEVHPAIIAAEKKIQAVLLELANDHGLAIDSVCVAQLCELPHGDF